jgi:deazaflavin-dependent oxidoreductase (nitroreductase family)
MIELAVQAATDEQFPGSESRAAATVPEAAAAAASADGSRWHAAERTMRGVFGVFNRWFAVPILRGGLGAAWNTPIGGYFLALKVTGRKSGRTLWVPLNYAIEEGSVFVFAGFGRRTQWFRNIEADPRVEVVTASGSFSGIAGEEADPVVRLRVLRAVLRNAGFAGFFVGYNPRTASDAELLDRIADAPLVRITPTGIGSGPADPGGWLWIAVQGAMALWLGRLAWGRARRVRRGAPPG